MVANLFGDHIKGKDYSYLPPIVQQGILLHRQIDDFVDTHPLVKELRLKLYQDLPKVAGIAIDLYFDHCLAKNWSKYHHKNLTQFNEDFKRYISNKNNLTFSSTPFQYPARFLQLLSAMEKYDILEKYAIYEGLNKASNSLSNRLSFKNNLDTAPLVFHQHEKEISSVFEVYMLDAIAHFS